MNPLKWLKGGLRTKIRVAVDRSMTPQQRAKARIEATPVKPKKQGKGGDRK